MCRGLTAPHIVILKSKLKYASVVSGKRVEKETAEV